MRICRRTGGPRRPSCWGVCIQTLTCTGWEISWQGRSGGGIPVRKRGGSRRGGGAGGWRGWRIGKRVDRVDFICWEWGGGGSFPSLSLSFSFSLSFCLSLLLSLLSSLSLLLSVVAVSLAGWRGAFFSFLSIPSVQPFFPVSMLIFKLIFSYPRMIFLLSIKIRSQTPGAIDISACTKSSSMSVACPLSLAPSHPPPLPLSR